ncbi:MAG: serine hydrolase domain-containing protein [Aeromicrobium sp.]
MTPEFGPVRELFGELIDSGREIGAGLSIWKGGREVVSLSGGTRSATGEPWTGDTLVHTFSTGKPLAALAALIAVARGRLSLDEPLAATWPAYGAHGKGGTTLRQVLSHTAGQPAFPESARGLDLLDAGGLIRALEESAPIAEPGSTICEHALTYGHLIDGALAAAGAGTVPSLLRETADEAGWDVHFGVPTDGLVRVADLEYLDPGPPSARKGPAFAYPAGTLDVDVLNSTRWRQGSFPAIGLHASASGLAKSYWELTQSDGPVVRAIGPELLQEYTAVQASGLDHYPQRDVEWTLGFQIDEGDITMGGLGGSGAWYSPGLDYSLGYVTRGLGDHERVTDLWHAVVACLSDER